MARLSLGQKTVVFGIMALIAVVSVVVFFSSNLLGKALAVLALGVILSSAYKILHS